MTPEIETGPETPEGMDGRDAATLPFSAKDLTFWRTEIKQARQQRSEVAETFGWDANLKRYIPKPAKNADGKPNAEVNIGADFRDVERKKAALFYDTPQVSLSVTQDRPIGQGPKGQPVMLSTLVSWQQQILNELLGPNHANVKPTVLKAIFDCLCPAGVGPVSVGYQVTMRTVERMAPVLDPTGQPMVAPVPPEIQTAAALGLMPMPAPTPLMQPVQVEEPIDERWFISRFSPKALLIPASFKDTDFARAPWLGKDWRKPLSQVRRDYKLGKDWTASAQDDETKPYFEDLAASVEPDDAGDPYVTGVEIYYRKALRSDEEVHPDALVQLVLVDGKDTPVIHRDCPWQEYTETGELSADSVRGFPDRPLVLRDLSDSAWIPSDCSVTGALTKELDKYRTQIVRQRDTNHNVILFDATKIDPTAKDKIVKGPGGDWVPVQEGALAQGKDAVMVQAAQVSLGRESYLGQDIIERDREGILGIGSNQASQVSRGSKTATEQSIIQRNSEARFEQERQRVLSWFLDLVSAFDTLILRYADARVASRILGPERGQVWAQFKSALAGGYSYDLRVDSGKYLDIEADRRQVLQFYNQVRKDPFINPVPIITEIAEKFGYDPAEFVTQPPPPAKELKAAFSFKGEDLNPASPAFALVVKIMRQAGWDINEADIQMAQTQAHALNQGLLPVSGAGPHPGASAALPTHPGAAPTAPTLNQHMADESGQRTGPKVM